MDGEGAVVGALAAAGVFRGVGKFVQLFPGEKAALFASFFHGQKGHADGAHGAAHFRAHHFPARDLFEGAEHGVAVEGAALNDDVLAQFFRVANFNDLLNGVSYDGIGEARGNIRHARPFFLGLLYLGIHKDGAATAQIHGSVAFQGHGGKFLHA